MAFQHGTNADFLVNGVDATGYCKSVSVDGETETAEVTTLGKVAKNYIPGLDDATVSFNGFYDGDIATPTAAFSYKLDSLRRLISQVSYMPQTDVLGGLMYFTEGELTKYKVETPVDDAGTFESEWQSNTGYERAITLAVLAARTATGQQVGVDNTSGTTNGGSGCLHVTAVSGTGGPTMTVKVQHSSNSTNGTDGVWTDLITFAASTLAGTSQRVEVTGTVNRWVRAQYTIAGTTPSFTFHLAFSRK